jgi:hypothetical protein
MDIGEGLRLAARDLRNGVYALSEASMLPLRGKKFQSPLKNA